MPQAAACARRFAADRSPARQRGAPAHRAPGQLAALRADPARLSGESAG